MSLDLIDAVLRLLGEALPARWRQVSGRTVNLREAQVFWRDLDFPEIGAFWQRQAVQLQLDRLSPLNPDLVEIDVRVEDGGSRPVRSRLYVVRRSDLDSFRSDASVAVVGVEGHPGVNFLRSDVGRRNRRLVTAAAAALVLLLTIVAPPLAMLPLIEMRLVSLEREIADGAKDARAVRDLRDRLAFQQAEVRQSLLRQGRRSRSELIEGLAHSLPDDSWVTDLSIDGDSIHIAGQSSDAGRLPPLLEAGGQLSRVRFNRPITSAPGGGELFDLVAEERTGTP